MLKAKLMGMEIENPLVVSAGPWTRGRKNLKKALGCGAGAIVTETIVSEPYPDISPRYDSDPAGGVQNIRLYSGLNLENWIEEINYLNEQKRYESKSKLIASIMGSSPSELGYIARKIEKSGVDGIEIGLSCPMGEGPEVLTGDPQRVFDYVSAVTGAVELPVSVKLSQCVANLPRVVDAAEKAGASGISAIDTIRGILHIDTETGRPVLPTYGGYSGTPIKPIALATVASAVQSTKLPVLGIGGIMGLDNLLEYIMVGAQAGAIGTGILLKGYQIVKEIIRELEIWAEEKQIHSLSQIRGCALKELRAFEEIKVEPKFAEFSTACMAENCTKCLDCCLDEALFKTEAGVRCDSEKCTGCGLCISVCPEKKIALEWK